MSTTRTSNSPAACAKSWKSARRSTPGCREWTRRRCCRPGLDLKDYLANLEQGLIQQALDDAGGVVARAAERLRIRRTTLVEKMRKYGMSRRDDDLSDD